MQKMFRSCVVALGLAFASLSAFAVTPSPAISPAMIAQFKNLSPAEQQRLAKQYGIELPKAGNATNQLAEPNVLLPQQNSLPESDAKLFVEEQQLDVPRQERKSERFGMNLFNPQLSTFAPVDNAPVAENYRLGPDDTLLLQLYGKQSGTHDLLISRDGTVTVPEVGPLSIAGLSVAQASDLIIGKVREAMIGVEAAVSMGKLRTINIFIAGEAQTPGMYAVSALTTVTQALFVAGGVSDIGSLREITIKRAGTTVGQFDLYDLLLKGDSRNDISLQHGDVVFIAPLKAIAKIEGAVKRPAVYEIKSGESLEQLLSMAGGTNAAAYPQSVVLERFNSNNLRDLINLDLTKPGSMQVPLKDGDVLRIAETSERVENVVTLAGAVTRPGFYSWHQNIKVSDLVKSFWADLHVTADLDYALVVREINSAGDIDVLQFNLANAVNDHNSADNISLKSRDLVLVFHHAANSGNRDILKNYSAADLTTLISTYTKQRDSLALTPSFKRAELLLPVVNKLRLQAQNGKASQLVSVTGEVKVPGTYPLVKGAQIADLIKAAGGLTEAAFLNQAELARAIDNSSSNDGVTIEHLSINLNQVFNGEQQISLQSRDRLNIFPIPDWNIDRTIELKGEIKFPGRYAIQRGEQLSDIIQRAGGLNRSSFMQGAIFIRENVKDRERAQIKKLSDQLRADIATKSLSDEGLKTPPAEAMEMINQLEKLPPTGRLIIDLPAILAGQPEADLPVTDGDVLYIPRLDATVSVLGEVQNASSHRYQPNLNVNDYLKLAGGPRKRADQERIYVIKANGSVMMPDQDGWFTVNNSTLEPGDSIIVPLDTEYKDSLSFWGQITQIFYQSAVALAAINTF